MSFWARVLDGSHQTQTHTQYQGSVIAHTNLAREMDRSDSDSEILLWERLSYD